MSQRAAWQLEYLGFTDVYDFVMGKAHWLATGRPTVLQEPADRVGDHLETQVAVVDITATGIDARKAISDRGGDRVVVVNSQEIVLGVVRSPAIDSVTPIVDVMSVGPTTIRPDEGVEGVRERMSRHNVPALIVTRPTGQLLGLFLNSADNT